MSDLGRKDLGDKAAEAVKPDSTKSNTKQATEYLSTTADKATAAVQPDSTKSDTQKLADTASTNVDKAQTQGKSVVEATTDGAKAGINTGAGEYLSKYLQTVDDYADTNRNGQICRANHF